MNVRRWQLQDCGLAGCVQICFRAEEKPGFYSVNAGMERRKSNGRSPVEIANDRVNETKRW